jgi:hypothetical protein
MKLVKLMLSVPKHVKVIYSLKEKSFINMELPVRKFRQKMSSQLLHKSRDGAELKPNQITKVSPPT